MTTGKLYPIVAPPGAGKNTISNTIVQTLNNCTIISASQILKESGLNTTSGILLSDNQVNSILIEKIQNELQNNKFVFIDGYPRTTIQLNALLSSALEISGIIQLDLSKENIESRILDRIVCPKCGKSYTKGNFNPPLKKGICDNCFSPLETRADDDLTTFRKRYDEYFKKTYPIIDEAKKLNIPIYFYNTITTKPQKIKDFLKTFLEF